GHFGDERPLFVTVLDREARARETAFRHLYPHIDQLANFSFHAVDTEDVHHFEQVLLPYSTGQRQASAVYVCLDSDSAGLACGLQLEEMLHGQHLTVVIRMEQDRGLATLLSSARRRRNAES